MMKIKLKIGTDWLFSLLYKIFLDYMYVKIQAPLFGYNGFVNNGSVERIFLGWIIYIIMYVLISTEESDTSSLFVHVIFFLSITPFISLYQFDTRCMLWMLVSQCICLLYINVLFSVGKKAKFGGINFHGVNYKNRSFRKLVFVFVMGYFGLSIMRFGIPNLRSMLFEEVYNTRTTANLSTFQSIIQNAICRIVCPLSMLVVFREKKWVSFSLLSLVQIYTYAVTGFKTYLFIPIVLIGLQFMPRLNLKKTIVVGLPIAVILLTLTYMITHNTMIYAVFGNRLFFLPAKIKYAYFDYFHNHPFVYFTQNSISRILGVKSNYETKVVYLIGEFYFNKPNMWTNTGFMADAYANLGFVGMALMGGLLALTLNLLIKQLKYVPSDLQKELQAVFVTFYISLNDGATISVLFSGGLLFAILIVCFVKFYDLRN